MNNRKQSPQKTDSTATKDAPGNTKEATDLLLVVYIHGFKGTDETFAGFPERLRHVLSETISDVVVQSVIFPAYETKGKLEEAIVRFADWLTTLTVEREVASGGGAGSAKIILCGHSMGGLVAADTLREFVKTRSDKTCPLWPKIIACIAFDTPYLGLHPYVVKNSVTRAAEYANTAKTVGSALFGSLAGLGAKKTADAAVATPSILNNQPPPAPQIGWGKWAAPAAFAIGGAMLAGAAAGGAYHQRDTLGQGYAWAMDHMKYVGNLWDEDDLKRRLEDLIDIEEQEGVIFRNFYTFLPPSPPAFLTPRTFVVLPKQSARSYPHFIQAKNGLAPDELKAHTGMFTSRTNDGYYELGLATAKFIREAIMLGRGVFEHDNNQPISVNETEESSHSSKSEEKEATQIL